VRLAAPDAARFGITLSLLEPGCVESELTKKHCCDSMPFLQPTARAVAKFVAGVERGRAVVRWLAHASLSSRLAAAVLRSIFDQWGDPQAAARVPPGRGKRPARFSPRPHQSGA
jgi:hypothetical protein